jgi:hypothetical protein
MLDRMRDTLAKKKEVFLALGAKNPALKRAIDPRNVYKRRKQSIDK